MHESKIWSIEVDSKVIMEDIMRVYVIEVITLGVTIKSKISQEGYKTLKEAQDWCRRRSGIIEQTSEYVFSSDNCEYIIHEVSLK